MAFRQNLIPFFVGVYIHNSASSHTDIVNHMIKSIPFYVVAFNRISGLKKAHDFVSRSSIPLELIVLDMGSTWEPFIKYRDALGVQVISFPYGMGPRDLWVNGELSRLDSGGFFLADGDIDYSQVSSKAGEEMVNLSQRYPWFPKVGLALKISDLPKDFEGNRIRDWEKGHWQVRWDKETFLTGLDTTTAYYPRRETTFHYRPALRIAGEYQAIHYPWYERPENFDDEAKFYTSLASAKISSAQASLLPNRSFKLKRLVWKLAYTILRVPLKSKYLGKTCIKVLSYRGTIPPINGK